MDRIVKKAYAKINLHLDIASRYSDGYHEVHTVMQTLSLCDDVEISLNRSFEGIRLSCDMEEIPVDEKNIAWRAAKLYLEEIGEYECGIIIDIKKRIPVCAGMGGGSSDAAAVLLGLEEIFGNRIGLNRLLEIGASIGADVPFCMIGSTAYADGKGDKITPLKPLPDCYVAVAQGGEGVSTPWAYKELDRVFQNFSESSYTPHETSKIMRAIDCSDIAEIASNMYNIFEEVVLTERPVVKQIKDTFIEHGALGAMMSGSGTAVFGIFNDKEKAIVAIETAKREGYFACLSRPVSV